MCELMFIPLPSKSAIEGSVSSRAHRHCGGQWWPPIVITVGFVLAMTASIQAADLTLRYDKPAPDTAQGWEREALPIGNGRIGAMIFGDLARERLQFNDISLWTGDEQVKGSYQAFGNLYINLP